MSWLSKYVHFIDPKRWATAGTPDKAAAKQLEQDALDQSKARYQDLQPFRKAGIDALQNAGSQQPWSFGSYNPDLAYQQFQPITNSYQSDPAVRAAFMKTQESPDRIALTKQALADMDATAAPELAARFKAVGQQAATLGRLGAGGVTTDLGNIESDYERNRIAAENASVRDAVSGDVTDRLNQFQAAQGYDAAGYGKSKDATQLATQQQGVRNQLGQDSLQARIQQWHDQQAARQQGYQNATALSSYGYGADPTATYLAVADRRQAQGNADQNSLNSGLQDLASFGGSYIGGHAYQPVTPNRPRTPYNPYNPYDDGQ